MELQMTQMQLYERRAEYVAIEFRYGKGLWVFLCNLFAKHWLRRINKIRVTGSYEELTKELVENPQGRRKNG